MLQQNQISLRLRFALTLLVPVLALIWLGFSALEVTLGTLDGTKKATTLFSEASAAKVVVLALQRERGRTAGLHNAYGVALGRQELDDARAVTDRAISKLPEPSPQTSAIPQFPVGTN